MKKIGTLTRTRTDNPGIEVWSIVIGASLGVRIKEPITGYSIHFDALEVLELRDILNAWLIENRPELLDRG